jgi:signal transduction histidine kinase
MNNESITAELLADLNIVVMERLGDGSFAIIGNPPDWFIVFYADTNYKLENLKLTNKFIFLENFLIDAYSVWENNEPKQLKSGIWTEVDLLGNEFNLEATALVLKNKDILLIERLGIAYDEKQHLIQKARENNLSYQEFIKEIQNKEVFLHCIVHDLAGPLSAISLSLELLELENLTTKGRKRLESAQIQCEKQMNLIREMLDAFSAEFESIYTLSSDPDQAPDILLCVREVVASFAPAFSLHNMQLQLEPSIDDTKDWKVVGEKSRLERILNNLVENAFRHSPANSTVTIGIQEKGKEILISVEDEGTGVSSEVSQHLFQKFYKGKDKPGKAGLGLYFCRLTVEAWGGTIGYSPRVERGSRFWFRLPKLMFSNS